jgi:hypothetical protein
MKSKFKCEDVIFRQYKGKAYTYDDVVALFPALPTNPSDPSEFQCYQHISQHRPTRAFTIMLYTRPAKPAEYQALKRELEAEPYKYRLRVVHRITKKHWRIREDWCGKARAEFVQADKEAGF